MTFKKNIIVFVLLFITLVLVGYIFKTFLLIGIATYYVLCLFCILLLCICKTSNFKIILNLILLDLLCYFIAKLIDRNFDLLRRDFYIFPGLTFIPYGILGMLSGYFIYKKSTRWLGIISVGVMSIFFKFKGDQVQSIWNYYVSFSNFGTIDPAPITFDWTLDYQGRSVKGDSFKDSIVVLDFWNSGCSNCFREMPLWDSISKKYTSNTPLIILPVFIPFKRDTLLETPYRIFENKNYQHLVPAIGSNQLASNFNVEGYPTVIVLKNNIKLFVGNQEKAIDWLSKNGYLK